LKNNGKEQWKLLKNIDSVLFLYALKKVERKRVEKKKRKD